MGRFALTSGAARGHKVEVDRIQLGQVSIPILGGGVLLYSLHIGFVDNMMYLSQC